MLEERVFTGGMDSDSDDKFVSGGDYRLAYCIRNSKKTDDSALVVTNCKGTKEIPHQLGSGRNKVIGSLNDKANNKIYFFIWNQLDYHKIIEFDGVSETTTPVLESSVLNFREESKILSPEIIDGVLYFTDGFNHPRKLNIARFKAGTIPSPLTENHINNIVPQHVAAPSCEYLTDNSIGQNNLRKRLWQFRIQNIDWDNCQSAWGTASKFVINEEENIYDTNQNYYPNTANNAIDVTFNTGDENIRKIKLAVRESNEGDFLLVKEFDKDELGIADNSTYTYRFFNDRNHIPIDPTENSQLQDFVPLKAKDQSLLGDSRRLGYFNINEGFDQVTVDVDMDYTVDERPVNLDTDLYTIEPVQANVVTTSTVSAQETQIVTEHIFKTQTSDTGNIISLTIRQYIRLNNATIVPTIQFIHDVQETFGYTSNSGLTLDVMNYFKNEIQNSTILNKTYSNGVVVSANAFDWLSSTGPSSTNGFYITMNVDSTGSADFDVTTDTVFTFQRTSMYVSAFKLDVRKSFKRGSKHPVGLVYYDFAGRRSTVMEDDSMNFYVPFFTEDGQYGPASLKMSITHTPPLWAHKYQIVYSGSDYADDFVQFSVKDRQVPNTGTAADGTISIVLDFVSYNTYYNGQSNVVYSFTKGDRMRLIKRQGTAGNDIFDKYYDYEVVSWDSGTQTLKYRSIPPNGDSIVIEGDLIEIYTPKLKNEERLYYEIGEVYDIGDIGLPSRYHKGNTQDQTSSLPAIVTLNDGDVYWRPRRIVNISGLSINLTKYFVEDFSFSDFYDSRIWDKSKPNKVDKNVRNIDRETSGYFSDKFIPETFINGLSTFYDSAFKYYDITNGSIQKVDTDDDKLIIFQEQKVGFSLINKQILNNADGSVNGTLSALSQVLSDMNYYAGDYGIGTNPESFTYYGGSRYFVDVNRGAVLKLGGNGIQRISSSEDAAVDSIKMNKYFTEVCKGRKDSGRTFFIYGAYHKDLEEYVLSFEEVRTLDAIIEGKDGNPFYVRGDLLLEGKAVAFSEDKGRWVTEYPWNEWMEEDITGLVSFRDGQMYINNKGDINSWYGNTELPRIDIVFNQNGNVNKFLKHITTNSTTAWESPSITNQYGQASSLDYADFEEFEGRYKAAFLQDANTPNITNPLIEGDDLRCHSFVIRLQNNSTELERLSSVVIGFESSELNN